jgi:hypothetical protein
MPYFVESLLNVKEDGGTYFLSLLVSFILLTILWHCWIVE